MSIWAQAFRAALASKVIDLGFSAVIAGGSRLYSLRSSHSMTDVYKWRKQMRDVYVQHGADGLARYIATYDRGVANLEDAKKLVVEFEATNMFAESARPTSISEISLSAIRGTGYPTNGPALRN